MKNDFDRYFRFLQFSLGLSDGKNFLSGEALADFDWNSFYRFAKKQSLIGVFFDGIQKLPQGVRLGEDLTMTWVGMSQKIKRRNVLLDQASAYIYNKVKATSYRCCILKGQGNALMYPNPSSRTPGDVDVWVNASRKEILLLAELLAKDKGSVGKVSLNHVELSVNGIAVELHSTPAIMNHPIYNYRLQKWLRRNVVLQCSNVVLLPSGVGEIAIPTNAFNVVYQLFHLYHHYLFEGIGLRQFVDFFFVVDDFYKVKENFSKITPSLFTIKEGSTSHPDPLTLRGERETAPTCRSEPLRSKVGGPSEVSPECLTQQSCDCLCGVNRLAESLLATADNSLSTRDTIINVDDAIMNTDALETLQRDLKHLGLFKFAGAVMYVLHEVLGLVEDKMIAPMDEMRGELLLDEILAGGNFGKHDERYGFGHGVIGHNMQRLFRDMRLVRFYPAEALSEPVFRTWHFLWRMWKK